MKSPLLQTPLPRLVKPLPDVYTIHERTAKRDKYKVAFRDTGPVEVPRQVAEAVEEYLHHHWLKYRGEISAQFQTEVLCALMVRYAEMGEYVECEPVEPVNAKNLKA